MFSLNFSFQKKKPWVGRPTTSGTPPQPTQASCFARRGVLRSGSKRLRKGSAVDARLATADGAAAAPIGRERSPGEVTRVIFFFGGGGTHFFV